MSPLFSSETRLYDLAWRDSDPGLLVEAWWGRESLDGGFEFHVDCLGTDAFIAPEMLVGKSLTLLAGLPDGDRCGRSGLVRAARRLDPDGGFGRYQLDVVPWTWLLSQVRHNRVFQELRLVEIIERVFAGYHEHAAWQWSDEVASFMAEVPVRSFCVQYRETDFTFVARLLAEEGIGWCVEEDAAAPAGHRLRLFADSARQPEDLLSAQPLGGSGIRFHRADSQQEQDAVVVFGRRRELSISHTTALSYDYKRKRAVAASVPAHKAPGGEHAPVLEHYDFAGQYAWGDEDQAVRRQRLAMEASEARAEAFLGRGTVRSFRPGTGFELDGLPFDLSGASGEGRGGRYFSLTEVIHAGINNLAGERIESVARRLAAVGTWPASQAATGCDAARPATAPRELPPELIQLAAERGYGNVFECVDRATPWRPLLADGTGRRLNPRPTAPGPMSAIVVGPSGESEPQGADELWCDALGRIKVRFLWQGDAPHEQLSCWLRPMSRQAGAGMGWQCLPRIGQEVLVGFVEGDIDRPVVLGALYNGRGEGGVAPTPGGSATMVAETSCFDRASDHLAGGQANLAGGNSPIWHGGAARSHHHPGAMSGIRSKEFGGQGHSQLLFDDSDSQQRVQLRSSCHASELNLGHLIHQAENYRGSFRGAGLELRTDAWGALRGGQGMLMTSWCAGSEDAPAGDAAAATALVDQARGLAATYSAAAAAHRTVQLASAIGARGAAKSVIDPAAPPLNALLTAVRGLVAGSSLEAARRDSASKNTAPASGKIPHSTAALILQAAKAGFGAIAGRHLQWSCGETVSLLCGEHSSFAIAGKLRMHAGQAIGLLGGASRAGAGETGISLLAARGDIALEAQSDELALQAKRDLTLCSVSADIDLAAARRIVLAVEGGASITIDGGITVACPGTITVHASKKSFGGPVRAAYALPNFPRSEFRQKKRFAFSS